MSTALELLPDRYRALDDDELDRRISAAKQALGESTVILGHHYQQDQVIRHADVTGDSLKLARWAARNPRAKFIVFCGVHFMAETADILAPPGAEVILPDTSAGCSMADMASGEAVEDAIAFLTEKLGKPPLPVVYINSSVEIKAISGRLGGSVCTSSNAAKVLAWAFRESATVVFLPDQHLGRNTALAMGLPQEQIALWDQTEGLLKDPLEDDKSIPKEPWSNYRNAPPRLILWNGYCSVHQLFRPEHVTAARRNHPGIKVVVHPECARKVVEMADFTGSTEAIIERIASSPDGTGWAVGTEINLVHRLANQMTGKTILPLNPFPCLCSTMYRISPNHLLWVLESLRRPQVINRIRVPEEVASKARLAIDRML